MLCRKSKRLLTILFFLIISSFTLSFFKLNINGEHIRAAWIPRFEKVCVDESISCPNRPPEIAKMKASEGLSRDVMPKRNEKKVVLFWTTFMGDKTFGVGLGDKAFRGCPVSNCETTIDKSRNNSADAIVYHMRNVDGRTVFPKPRLPHQRYIFYLLEHPHHQWNDLSKYKSVFNWTMTYRTDSDIPILYGQSFPRDYQTEEINLMDIPRTNFSNVPFVKKKKNIAWFVSNCRTQSKRELYAEELSRHIDVDIFGQCGNLSCPSKMPWHRGLMHVDCYEMLEQKYRFYLSFESNICKDYVTEKLFNALKLHVIPIVYGEVNYSKVAPPQSVININDYASPKDLAAYLKTLASNEKAYNEYFHWKESYYIKTDDMKRKGFCDLCNKLNDPTNPPKVYKDLDSWWGKNSVCDLKYIDKLKQRGKW